jgi:hypothetical protein
MSVTCNTTSYQQWRQQNYNGILNSMNNFWIYPSQPLARLTNGIALDLVSEKCKIEFQNLRRYYAGKSGPISIQDSYDVMCSLYCLESDNLHVVAMTNSSCSCLQLSTPISDPSYNGIIGDYCHANSARRLCKQIGYCGVWNCRIDDFMCPRHEFNKKKIPLRGQASSCSINSAETNLRNKKLLLILISITIFYLTILA